MRLELPSNVIHKHPPMHVDRSKRGCIRQKSSLYAMRCVQGPNISTAKMPELVGSKTTVRGLAVICYLSSVQILWPPQVVPETIAVFCSRHASKPFPAKPVGAA